MTSIIILAIGYLDTEGENSVLSSLNQKIRLVSDERTEVLWKTNMHNGPSLSDWSIYMGTADRLDADALIKYFMGIKLFNNDHMQLFIARNGPTNFESYWNGGGDAQTQFRGNANWRRGK